MRRCSLKVAPRHDRMYIIGLLACADHFTTSSTQSQTHTSRSPRFLGLESGSACANVHQGAGKQDTMLNLFRSAPGEVFPTFSSDPSSQLRGGRAPFYVFTSVERAQP